MRERSFTQGKKRINLREMTNAVAIRKESLPSPASQGEDISEEIARQSSRSQLRAFEKAGWVFRERTSEGMQPATDEEIQQTPQAHVFVKADGRLVLATNLITVKFKTVTSEGQANEALAPYGCRVVEAFSFSPGLFRAAVINRDRGDAVAIADEVSRSGLVDFAEPELIEVIGRR